MKRCLISINDFEPQEILALFDLAQSVKREPGKFHDALKGKIFGLIFEKPSTRTWVSFETGIFSLGGAAIYLGPEDIKLGVREEVRDVARVLERYLAGVILRTFAHKTITEFRRYFAKPVINGLSDFEHPCQALADYMTIREKFSDVRKPAVVFVGDGNNVLNSLILLAAKLGGRFRFATPAGHQPPRHVLETAEKMAKVSGATIEGGNDPVAAVRGADVVYTDVWVSMGEEKMRQTKMQDFAGFQINDELMKHAHKDAFIMHCLPAHRGEEITEEVFESKRSIVFDQAENRLHIQNAILLTLAAEHS